MNAGRLLSFKNSLFYNFKANLNLNRDILNAYANKKKLIDHKNSFVSKWIVDVANSLVYHTIASILQAMCVEHKFLEEVRPVLKVYRIRWLILVLYIVYATFSFGQWLQYSILTNLLIKYYGVSVSAVDWTSMMYMITWPIGVFPSSYIVDRGVSIDIY